MKDFNSWFLFFVLCSFWALLLNVVFKLSEIITLLKQIHK